MSTLKSVRKQLVEEVLPHMQGTMKNMEALREYWVDILIDAYPEFLNEFRGIQVSFNGVLKGNDRPDFNPVAKHTNPNRWVMRLFKKIKRANSEELLGMFWEQVHTYYEA